MPTPTHPPTDTGAIGAGRSVLTDLLERVEAAETWYDRSTLDVDLALTLGVYVKEKRGRDAKPWLYPTDPRGFRTERPPAYTASLDSALALCDRVLGDVNVRVTKYRKGGARGEVLAGGENHDIADEQAATPALALLAAMLRALLAQAPSPATTPTGVLETSLIVEGENTEAEGEDE